MSHLVTRYALPRFVVRGVETTLDMDVYDAAGVQLTASAGTIQVLAGSREVVAAGTAVTTLGPPSTFTLTTAVNATTESLTRRWLENWTLTLPAANGGVQTFRRETHLVRTLLFPTITDDDLLELHADLDKLRPPTLPSYEPYREAAWVRLNRRLIGKGTRPELVISSYALAEIHRFMSLEIIFRDFASASGDGRYERLADEYRQAVEREWDTIHLTAYDEDRDGVIDAGESRPTSPVVFLNRAPQWERYGGSGGY